MPRVRRAGHVRRNARLMGRAEAIQTLIADPWGILALGLNHEALAAFSPNDAASILAEAMAEGRRQRSETRMSQLRDRLQTWPVSQWGAIFSECPELEKELTPAQRAEWEANR